jgi:hypothetical protein
MADDQQRAARGNGIGARGVGGRPLVGGQVHVVHGHEVELSGRRGPRDDVGGLPGDAPGDVGAGAEVERPPGRFDAVGGPAEILTIFDRDGRRAHLGGVPD